MKTRIYVLYIPYVYTVYCFPVHLQMRAYIHNSLRFCVKGHFNSLKSRAQAQSDGDDYCCLCQWLNAAAHL